MTIWQYIQEEELFLYSMSRQPDVNLVSEAAEIIAARFRLFGEPMRLRILIALGEKELTVTEVVEATGGHQANISKHLGILLDSGVVRRRKEGVLAYYSVADPTAIELCATVCRSLQQHFESQKAAVRGLVPTLG
jgi:DNA-binding transcriptional ArsR family regulator